MVVEKSRKISPLLNLKLMTHKIFLPANISLMIVSITMFLLYQSIPILVRSPKPLGFGGGNSEQEMFNFLL